MEPVAEESAFSRIAPWYEALMSSVPYDMWVSYLRLVWSALDLRPESVLDVCCGTGAMCRMLAKDGIRMAGVDLSAPMIREAVRRANQEGIAVSYTVADAAEMDLGEKFDAAYSFFDSLNYITDPNRLAQAFERIAAHLHAGGAFLFDLNTAYAFEMGMFDQKDLRRSAPVRYVWKSEWNPRSRLCTVRMEFEANGERFREVHVQRAHSEEEIQAYLLAAGFRQVRIFDAYTLNPPRRESDRIHVLAVLDG